MMAKMKKFFKNLGGQNTNRSLGKALMFLGGLFLLIHVGIQAEVVLSGHGIILLWEDAYIAFSLILGIGFLVFGNLLRKTPY